MRVFRIKMFLTKYKVHFFLLLSSLILLFLVFVQIRWVNKAMQFSENKFKYKVGLALDATILEFASDSINCNIIEHCLYEGSDCMFPNIGNPKIIKLDSIFQKQLTIQNINSPYSLELLTKAVNEQSGFCFNYNLNYTGIDNDTAVLNVMFNSRQSSIIESMKMLFVCSIVLILLLSIFFVSTIVSLLKEKRIQGQITDLVNNITHEFKTPMATISLVVSMLRKTRINNNPDKILYYSDIISAENTRLSMQVDQLLKLQTLEKGEITLSLEKINIIDVLIRVCDLVNVRFENIGKLKLDLHSKDDFVLGDYFLLENVFLNLIDNAIKYSIDNLLVEISCFTKNKMLYVSIKDHGIGISKEDIAYVYDKYYRVSSGNVHDVKGFGIGLSYAREVVKAHKGSIMLTSKLGVGSVFTVKLPIL